jgi:hypothetical protein
MGTMDMVLDVAQKKIGWTIIIILELNCLEFEKKLVYNGGQLEW